MRLIVSRLRCDAITLFKGETMGFIRSWPWIEGVDIGSAPQAIYRKPLTMRAARAGGFEFARLRRFTEDVRVGR